MSRMSTENVLHPGSSTCRPRPTSQPLFAHSFACIITNTCVLQRDNVRAPAKRPSHHHCTVLSWRGLTTVIFSRIRARVERGELWIPAGHAVARDVAGTECVCGKGMDRRGTEVSTSQVSRISQRTSGEGVCEPAAVCAWWCFGFSLPRYGRLMLCSWVFTEQFNGEP